MTKDFIDALRANPYVREKELGNSISSFNFTNKAFWDAHWDNETIKARGLFIDTKSHKIVARGYEKFFTLEEHKRMGLDYDIQYPLAISRKENGYLGLFSVLENGEPFFASKSTNKGWFAEEFERILRTKLGAELDILCDIVAKNDVTLVFEVISMEDKHIIGYNQDTIVLLDAIQNSIEPHYLDYDALGLIADYFNLDVRSEPIIVHNDIELKQMEQFADEDKTEGFVARDTNGFMFKYKSYYYRYWKNLRGVMQQLWAGKKPEDIKHYHERCMEPIHEECLPRFCEIYHKNNEKYGINPPIMPHILDYQKAVLAAFSSEIHDIQ